MARAEGRVSRRSLHPLRALLTWGHLAKGKPRRKNFRKKLLIELPFLLNPSSGMQTLAWWAIHRPPTHWGSLTGTLAVHWSL